MPQTACAAANRICRWARVQNQTRHGDSAPTLDHMFAGLTRLAPTVLLTLPLVSCTHGVDKAAQACHTFHRATNLNVRQSIGYAPYVQRIDTMRARAAASGETQLSADMQALNVALADPSSMPAAIRAVARDCRQHTG